MSLVGPATFSELGIKGAQFVQNPGAPQLYEAALRNGEGVIAQGGPLAVYTDKTGRSPKDRFIVRDALTADAVWWEGFNQPISPEVFERLHKRMQAFAAGRELFVQDLFAGTDPQQRLSVRFVQSMAYHSLFVQNLFVRPDAAQQARFVPDWTVLNLPDFKADPARDGTRSETFILVNFSKKMILVGGTQYAGENKKGIFGVLNFLLPARGVLPMHCSANADASGAVSLFFGLSGTGKTTLSADPERFLIGDDEHGWSDSGVFNFEGGCYAKAIRLSQQAEPDIYRTTQMFGTVLENVVLNADRSPDLDDASLTENTRAAYPIDFIPQIVPSGLGRTPNHLFFLTADAYGVLPPLARLSPEQAMYYFLSGFTAKIPGTEQGVTDPEPTFSACFGAPFMPRHPGDYAKLLGERLRQSGASVWLVNTGWSGGGYGVGQRMPIAHTRALLRAVQSGGLDSANFETEPHFGLQVPKQVPGVPQELLNPRRAWADVAAYDRSAARLAGLFRDNFKRFESGVAAEVAACMPQEQV